MFHLSQTLPGLFLMHDSFITGFVTRLTRRVPLLDQELLTLPEHLSSPPVCSGVRVTRSLVLYVCFVDRFLSFGTFSFGHCVCLFFFDIRILITSLWYLQALLSKSYYAIDVRETEEAIKNRQSRETSNIGYTRHRTNRNKTKKHNIEN
jgi:hypothetical protein